jgi:uroporphyrinogen-III synthase
MRIGVTRAADRAEPLMRAIRELGAVPVPMPTLASRAPENFAPLDAGLAGDHAGWVFASARAVAVCASRVDLASAASGRVIAAVGAATADALGRCGVMVDYVPERFRAEELLAILPVESGSRWLVPRALEGREVIEAGIRERGGTVDAVVAYRTVVAPAGPVTVGIEGLDVVTFASGSAVRNAVTLLGLEGLEGVAVASIGPVTSAICRELGLAVTAEAMEARLESLAHAAVAAGGGVGP